MDYYNVVYQVTEPTLKACFTTVKVSNGHAVTIDPELASKLKKVQVTSNKTEFSAFGIKFIPKEFDGKILFDAEPEFDYYFDNNALKDIKPKISYYDLFKKLIKSIDNSYIYDYDDEDLTNYVYGKSKGADDCG